MNDENSPGPSTGPDGFGAGSGAVPPTEGQGAEQAEPDDRDAAAPPPFRPYGGPDGRPSWNQPSPSGPPPVAPWGPWSAPATPPLAAAPGAWAAAPASNRSPAMVLFAGLGGVVLGAAICVVLIVLLADLTNFSDYGDMGAFEDEMGMGLAEQYETDSAAVDMKPTDCLDSTEPADADVGTVPCDDAHELEVFVRRPIFEEEDAAYSAEDLEILGDAMCVTGFESYVDTPYFDSDLDYRTFVPSKAAWEAGERDVVCVLFDLDGTTLEGTSKGSRR